MDDKPNQPGNFKFPKRSFGQRNPKLKVFYPQWFTHRPWLHYDEVFINQRVFTIYVLSLTPAGTWRRNDVEMTSMQHADAASMSVKTSFRRHVPAGMQFMFKQHRFNHDLTIWWQRFVFFLYNPTFSLLCIFLQTKDLAFCFLRMKAHRVV